MTDTGRRRLLRTLVGAAVLVVTVDVCGRLSGSSGWMHLGVEVSESVRPRPGAWRLLRGTMHYLAIPALLMLAAGIGLTRWRRDRRAALTFAAVLLGTNLAVQAVKHVFMHVPTGLNPLSGHVGIAVGLGFGYVCTLRGGSTRWSAAQAWMAVLLMAGTGVAVLLTGWHTLPQVLAPMGIGAGCALLVGALAPIHRAGISTITACGLLFAGIALGAVALWAVVLYLPGTSSPVDVGGGVVALSCLVAAVASVAVGTIGLMGISVGASN